MEDAPALPGINDLARLVRALRREVGDDLSRLAAATVLGGLAEAGTLAMAHTASLAPATLRALVPLFLGYAFLFSMQLLLRGYLLLLGGHAVLRMVHELRVAALARLRHVELQTFEHSRTHELRLRLARDLSELSNNCLPLFHGLAAFSMLIAFTLYIATLSVPAFLVTLLGYLGLLLWLLRQGAAIQGHQLRAARAEGELFRGLEHLLGGFSQVKMDEALASSLVDQHLNRSSRAAAIQLQWMQYADGITQIRAELISYLLGFVIIFVLPALGLLPASVITAVISAFLYTLGSSAKVMTSLTLLSRSAVTMKSLAELESDFRTDLPDVGCPPHEMMVSAGPFRELSLKGVTFAYPRRGGEQFRVGPVDLTIRRGDVLFVVGGNGSGKSTLLKVLCGLYPHSTGEITLNGVPVSPHNQVAYRQRFTTVFTDFHLFERLYGYEDVDEKQVHQLLTLLRLEHKVAYRSGRFTTLDLSTGQRKRLALLCAILTGRELMILDEVAADQDPDFRRVYYVELLPWLRDRGATLIVVSHDDAYFVHADRLMHLDRGRVEHTLDASPEEAQT